MANLLGEYCVKFTFRDAKGQTRSIRICYSSDQDSTVNIGGQMIDQVISTVPLLQACTNAHVQCEAAVTLGAAQSGVTWGSTGDYQSVSTQLKLYYLTVDPTGDPAPTAAITIPAPKTSLFLADLVTVNPENAAIVALNGAAGLNVGGLNTAGVVSCSGNGLLFSTFVGGVMQGKKLSRRWSRYTKDPTLTYAGI